MGCTPPYIIYYLFLKYSNVRAATNKIAFLLLAIFVLVSCNIKEDMSDCPGYILLDYTSYPQEILDDIDSEAIVNVYMFDNDDVCDRIYSFSYAELESCDFSFEVPIEYRGHKVVVWHGASDDDYDSSSMGIGESLDDFYLKLNYLSDNTFDGVPSELWASEAEEIDFCASITRHRIYMMRLHTEVSVTLSQQTSDGQIVSLDMRNYPVSIENASDVYYRDYTISSQSKTITYNNASELSSSQSVSTAHLGMLRVSAEQECSLYVTDASGQPLEIGGLDKLDLLSYMLSSGGVSGEEEQTFLDLNKVWEIELLLAAAEPDTAQLVVALIINGWIVWFDSVEL